MMFIRNKLVLILTLLFSVGCFGSRQNDEEKNYVLLKVLIQSLEQAHYQPKAIDDDFSKAVFEQYLKKVDVYKLFYTQEDIKKLEAYQSLIDDEINRGTFQFLDLSYEIISNRIGEVQNYYLMALDKPFDYTEKEKIEFDFDKIGYPKDEDALKERWRKFTKYYTLQRLHDLDLANEDADQEEAKSFEELENEAREKVKKNFDNWFRRLKQLEKRDRFSDYLNAITSVYDPHTNYYAPKAKEDFDIEFSGRLEGIGARLSEKDGFITVAEIVTGSASWRQGDLEAEDKILKVAQENEDPVDIVGMRIDDAVQLIRGKKGTKVVLTVRKPDGLIKEIAIIRDVVIFEHTYAKSAIIENGHKTGYIKLPSFYADFSESGEGRRCAVDVKKEIIKLKGEGIKSLILDLRNNGGGSLADVVEMAGLFIETGPVVQVKGRDAAPTVLKDEDPSIYYEGPLVILVNQFSASASEIMAAAMQDYGRAVIIGSGGHTFGKGTVQRIIDIDNLLVNKNLESKKPFGSVMLTMQKFYRIDGTTNQLKGVIPDIALPNQYSKVDYGEKDLDFPIEWDEITPARYEKSDLTAEQLDQLRNIVLDGVSQNPKFALINENAKNLKVQRDKTSYTLNYKEYKKEREELKEKRETLKLLNEEIEGLKVYSPEVDQSEEQQDSVKMDRAKRMHESLKKDIYVEEAIKVLEALAI
jgi:carboxyl-terminal processing protease